MGDVAEWIRGRLASKREPNQQSPGNGALGTVFQNIIAERANQGSLVVTDGAERSIDDERALARGFEDERAAAILFVGSTTEPGPDDALLASGSGFPRLPFAEDGVFIVDAESGRV